MDAQGVQQIYDRMWDDALATFAHGRVEVDRFLVERAADRRTGITLIARLGQEVIARCQDFLRDIRASEPDQHYYRADELHVTVLSLVSASEAFDLRGMPLPTYQSVLGQLLARSQPFTIQFTGVTASAGSVLLQGHVDGDHLNTLRHAIRQELGRVGLAGSLDTRYKIVTAHATAMRFRSQPHDLGRLIALLSAARGCDFGAATVRSIEFVSNDWYMSHDRVNRIATFMLGQ
jgi:2'-5' RNA ligase